MLPTSHHHYLAITGRDNKQIRGKVVYIQPKKERWRQDHAVVHITTSDWLEPYRYPAVYRTPTQSFAGTYVVLSYKMEGQDWLFRGVFEQEGASAGNTSPKSQTTT